MRVVSADVLRAHATAESHLEECSLLCSALCCSAILPDIMFFRLR
jgi:hypothetical protein